MLRASRQFARRANAPREFEGNGSVDLGVETDGSVVRTSSYGGRAKTVGVRDAADDTGRPQRLLLAPAQHRALPHAEQTQGGVRTRAAVSKLQASLLTG